MRTRHQPAPRTLASLVIGHVVVAAGAVVLVVLLALDRGARPAGSPSGDGLAAGQLFTGLAALGVAQGLSIRRLIAHRRGLLGDPGGGREVTALVAGMVRIELTMALALYPLVVGATALLITPPPAPLLALCCAVPCASLLLDQAHSGWAHRRLDGWGPRVLLLPPGTGARLRRKMRGSGALLVVLAVMEALVAVGSAVHALAGGATALLGLLTSVAAGAAGVLAVLLVGPVRRSNDALRGDAVGLPELDSAVRAMRRFGPAGAVGTALLAVAVLAGGDDPRLGVAAAVPFAVTLGVLSVQVSLAIRARLGVPVGDRPARRIS
jgi:hypothetical protein